MSLQTNKFVFKPQTEVKTVPITEEQKQNIVTEQVKDQAQLNQKHENFAVSLRQKKKAEIIQMKRMRNINTLTKAKFLGSFTQNESERSFAPKTPQEILDILDMVLKGLGMPLNHPSSGFSVPDLI